MMTASAPGPASARHSSRRARRLIAIITAALLVVMIAAAAVLWPRAAPPGAAADIALPEDPAAQVDVEASDDAIWKRLNEAMADGDRAAFLAQAGDDGRAALARWWDNTRALGWDTGVFTPTWESETGDFATVVVGGRLPFAPDPARGSGHPDAGLVQVQGSYYSVSLSGEGGERRITDMRPSSKPEPWDEGSLYVQRREHVVLYGQADERALVDAEIHRAEAAAVRALQILDDIGGAAPVEGFVVAITGSDERIRRWQFGTGATWEMTVAAYARPMVRPPRSEPWIDARIATGSGHASGTTIVLGPRSAGDRDSTLVHEYAHALLAAAHPSLEASPPAAVTEGFARVVEWRGGLTEPGYTRSAVKRAVAQHGADAFSNERMRASDSWKAYAAAGSYYAFVADHGGSVWDVALAARADADGLVGYARAHPDLSIAAWQQWVAAQGG